MTKDETLQRLHETGYFFSKFGKDKTWTQEELMEMFRFIIEGDNEEEKS